MKVIVWDKNKGRIEGNDPVIMCEHYLHREDGPAVLAYHDDGELFAEVYYLEDSPVIEKELEKLKHSIEMRKKLEQL